MPTSDIIEQSLGPGSQGAAADEIRARLHGMWASVAPAWGEHADCADARGAALTEHMLQLSTPRPGERVLELACGPGGLGLAAAERVAPGGEVVLSDVVAEMTAIAAARADALGLTNVTTCVLDIERIEQPDESYDLVLCREGLMFALDPARAAREIRSVLRPGGRVAIAVWGPRERNPWLGIVLDAASAQLGTPIPPPGIPGPFSLEDSDQLAALLSDAELSDITTANCQCEHAPPASRSGGRERAHWRGRSRTYSPHCPSQAPRRFAPGHGKQPAPTRHPPAWSSPE